MLCMYVSLFCRQPIFKPIVAFLCFLCKITLKIRNTKHENINFPSSMKIYVYTLVKYWFAVKYFLSVTIWQTCFPIFLFTTIWWNKNGKINMHSVTTKLNFSCFSHISRKQKKTKLVYTFTRCDRTFTISVGQFTQAIVLSVL